MSQDQRWRARSSGLAAALLLLLGGCSSASSGPPTVPPVPTVPTEPVDSTTAYVPGESYFGRNEYVEYIAGDLPIILSAPHGGHLEPAEIPNRTADRCGGSATTVRDMNTRELVLAMQAEIQRRFGGHAHVVINHLHRRKLDANRAMPEAACGDAQAEQAWEEFQEFLEQAGEVVLRDHERGWYMDMHGHGHEIQRLELGYLLTGAQLDQSDEVLASSESYRARSSIRTLAEESGLSFPEVLRGSESLGALYAEQGFPAVPSPTSPGPAGAPYFTGGYNTRRHTCGTEAGAHGGQSGGSLCGVQIEANYAGVRDTEASRARFAEATAAVLESYLGTHWELELVPVAY